MVYLDKLLGINRRLSKNKDPIELPHHPFDFVQPTGFSCVEGAVIWVAFRRYLELISSN
jgi:hypothetical protein